MASAKQVLISTRLLFLLLLCLPFSSSTAPPSDQHSLVVAPSAKLQLSHGGVQVKTCPNSKPGISMVCERVRIYGLSRIQNLWKFSHSVKIKVSVTNSTGHLPKAGVCFHRNMSLGLGMCPKNKWENVSNGSWARSASPFGHKVLDIRAASSSLESFEVSIEEELHVYRVVCLALGMVMMSLASFLSNSLVFYYGTTMASGGILVIVVVFFQGLKKAMELLPTGSKTSLFIYSSVVGLVSFLFYYFPGIWHSILTEAGISEEMYYALVVFLVVFLILAGGWLAFWVVHKHIPTEDGSIDTSTSLFVAWSIRILSALLILQSSVDPMLATEALIFGMITSSILRSIFRLRRIRYIYRELRKSAKRKHKTAHLPGSSALEDPLDRIRSNEDFSFRTIPRSKNFTMVPSSPADRGFSGSGSNQLYISSFHTTPEGRRFSKPEWEKFTRESTDNALEELASSPGFGKWLSQNADRITVTPPSSSRAEQRSKWFSW
ncbi:uncharacterized protein LOC21399322 [Morus notabilis]|uniref:uncharacterized protein LOC21399322 n=1 Tax=Morus notabilis TaxID=981085 RepID=UPI000CED69F5|nr:uncharacterized protein LOC21399322 [Morus notabilis]